jgi:hypothetical protein
LRAVKVLGDEIATAQVRNSHRLYIDATIGVFGCPPTIVKFQPQLLKT